MRRGAGKGQQVADGNGQRSVEVRPQPQDLSDGVGAQTRETAAKEGRR